MADAIRRDVIDDDEDAGLLDDGEDKAAAFLGVPPSVPARIGDAKAPEPPSNNGGNGHAEADTAPQRATVAIERGPLTDISEAVARWDDGIQERMRRLDARMSAHERELREVAEVLHEIGGSRDGIGQKLKSAQKEMAAALQRAEQAVQRADAGRPQMDDLAGKIATLTTRADNSAKRLSDMAGVMDDMLVMQSQIAGSRARGTAMQSVALFFAAVALAAVGYTQWPEIVALASRLFSGGVG